MATEGARPMNRSPTIAAIYRYPVKGLSAESLVSTRLAAGQTIAADRLYAIENGPSGFDPAAPAYLPKQRFLMLMRNERLARLQARFDAATHVLAIELEGARVASGDLRPPAGRASIEGFFAEFCADELRGDRGRSRDGGARPADPQHAVASFRPWRLRRLCRGDGRRRDRGGGCGGGEGL